MLDTNPNDFQQQVLAWIFWSFPNLKMRRLCGPNCCMPSNRARVLNSVNVYIRLPTKESRSLYFDINNQSVIVFQINLCWWIRCALLTFLLFAFGLFFGWLLSQFGFSFGLLGRNRDLHWFLLGFYTFINNRRILESKKRVPFLNDLRLDNLFWIGNALAAEIRLKFHLLTKSDLTTKRNVG